jgi:hypothetical protein
MNTWYKKFPGLKQDSIYIFKMGENVLSEDFVQILTNFNT